MEEDLIVSPCGIRAQAVDNYGNLVDDFIIKEDLNMIHVINAPSPAATSSLSIASFVYDKYVKNNIYAHTHMFYTIDLS